MNLAYLTRQLQLAADCIQRGLDIVATEAPADDVAPPGSCQCNDPTVICPVHPRGPTAAELLAPADPFPVAFTTPASDAAVREVFARKAAAERYQEPPDPLARSMALAMAIQKQIEHGKLLVALTERLDTLTKIVLDVAPDACARHDLFGF